MGRVGSSTDLIVQHIEYVSPDEKQNTLLDLISTVEGLTLVSSEMQQAAPSALSAPQGPAWATAPGCLQRGTWQG